MNNSKLSFALYFTEDKILFHNLFKRFDDVTLSENALFQNKKSSTLSITLFNSGFSTSLLDSLTTPWKRGSIGLGIIKGSISIVIYAGVHVVGFANCSGFWCTNGRVFIVWLGRLDSRISRGWFSLPPRANAPPYHSLKPPTSPKFHSWPFVPEPVAILKGDGKWPTEHHSPPSLENFKTFDKITVLRQNTQRNR